MKPLTCKEFIDFLAEYLDGELSAERVAIFDQHLAICPDCVAYLESYKSTIGLLKDASRQGDSELPEDATGPNTD